MTDAALYLFHCSLQARPDAVAAGPVLQIAGRDVSTLQVDRAALGQAFSVSFEQAADALNRLPRMYCEPDGSFVQVSPAGELPAWQVDGVLYDRGGRLLHVDLKGTCQPAAFDELLRACGWPTTPVIFQLSREAVWLEETEFRRHAVSSSA